jgi:hypothetical protein
MPRYEIHLTNSEFSSRDDPRDYVSLDDAVQAAVGAAVDIVRDLISRDAENSATVEASVLEDGEVVARRIITISTLQPDND